MPRSIKKKEDDLEEISKNSKIIKKAQFSCICLVNEKSQRWVFYQQYYTINVVEWLSKGKVVKLSEYRVYQKIMYMRVEPDAYDIETNMFFFSKAQPR